MKFTQMLAGPVFLLALFILPVRSHAHCDTLKGPVVQDARYALQHKDITPVLKWVGVEDAEKIRAAFKETLAVRALGDQARELADRYFLETLVRIHRAGEGAPYTGLKSGENIDPAVRLADQALESGKVDKLVEVLTEAMAAGIRERFHQARQAQRHVDENVQAGRDFVHSYVIFTHYVEGLHEFIKAGGAHHEKTVHDD